MAPAGVIDALTLPARREATEPPEARGLRRDEVRLLVSHVDTDSVAHSRFRVAAVAGPGRSSGRQHQRHVESSADGRTRDDDRFELHLSTRLPENFWVIEVRRPGPVASLPCRDMRAGTLFELEGGGRMTLLAPYPLVGGLEAQSRLWMAALDLAEPVLSYLERFGNPIRYNYVPLPWPESIPDRLRN